MENSMCDMSLGGFVEKLSSSSPTPGGGGTSALCGALAAALGLMVGELTVGKKRYAEYEESLRELMEKTSSVRDELLSLIDGDAAAFEPLSRAYSMSKDDPSRDKVMEKCLRDAAAAPMRILELCCEVISLHEGYAATGSRLAVSDAGTGVVLAWGAMYGAAMNVAVNTHAMKDREYAEAMNARVRELMNDYYPKAEKVYEDVFALLA